MLSRRDFLGRSALIALAPTIPAFLARTARALPADRDGRILVVIQLDGGNDGINTVVPFSDDAYARSRKSLRLEKDRVIKIDDRTALHASLQELDKLLHGGRLAIVQGVGYPNPSRSHAQGMAVWQSASLDTENQNSYGWLGRALDADRRSRPGAPASVFLGTGACPLALRGRRSLPTAIDRLEEFQLSREASAARSLRQAAGASDLAAFIHRSALDAYATADRLQGAAAGPESSVTYPQTRLAEQLHLIGRLIKAGFSARVYYAVHLGYDTHAGQLFVHANLLRELSQAIGAFMQDLAAAKLDDRIAVMTFSEFGRQLRENASAGTDHGTAAPMFLAGNSVHAGLAGQAPSLTDLHEGEPKMTVDFRRVYASILQQWLGLRSAEAIEAAFPPLNLFAA